MINYEYSQLKGLVKEFDIHARRLSREYGINKYIFYIDELISWFLYGANPKDYFRYNFYKLNHRGKKEFFTMRNSNKTVKKFNNKDQIYMFVNKADFNLYFSKYIGRKWIYAPEAEDGDIISFIKSSEVVFIKPNSLSSGKGIYKVSFDSINSNLNEFCKKVQRDNCLIEEVIIQHDKMKSLNPSSVNTIRGYTFMDGFGKPHIIATTLRVAGEKDSSTDNFHSGGIIISVEVENGICISQGINNKFEKFTIHPITKTIIPGFQVPFWSEVKELLLEAATIVPSVRYVGWDVAITPDGPILIEGNHDANHYAMQVADQVGKYRMITRNKWS